MDQMLQIIRKAVRRGEADAWITDNDRLIVFSARMAKKAGLPHRFSRLTEALREWLTCLGFSSGKLPTEPELQAFFAGKDLTHAELCAVPACLCYFGVERLAEICSGRREPFLSESTVGLLRLASELDPDPLFAAAWKPEALLAKADPSYAASTASTRAHCREALARSAKKQRLSERAACEKLLFLSRKRHLTVWDLLFPRKTCAATLCAWALCFAVTVGASVTAAFFLFGRTLLFPLLLFLPLAQGFAPFCDRFASLFDCTPPAPRLKLERVPDEGRTVVAVTTLLERGNTDATDRLERFCCLSPSENVFFCLLADLPEAGGPTTREDAPTLQALKTRIDALRETYGDRFFLFWRDREPLENGVFGARERKRGAVGALLGALRGETTGNVYGTLPDRVNFLLTLDADTEFAPGFLTDLLGAALHPANRRFGVIQPAVQTTLQSTFRTRFSRLVAGQATLSGYEHAVFDRGMSLFGEGIFCGKGLLRIDRFRARSLSLPEGKILSHDLPEGGRAGTLAMPDLLLADSVPATPISWNRRAHRWIRGDVQNLVFLGDRRMSFAARRQIAANLLCHLTPCFSLLAILAGTVLLRGETEALLLLPFACFHLLFPCLSSLLSDLWKRGPSLFRHALTGALSAAAESLSRLCWELVSLCRNAFLAADAIFRALWRMCVSKKRLLEWTTAAAGEAGAGRPAAYLRDGILSAAVGTLLFLFGGASPYRLIGLVFFLYPPVAYFLSRPPERVLPASRLTPKDRALLSAHAEKMWSFFAENVSSSTRHLPPDNRQFFPRALTDLRTSPTNIGLYLLSVLAAMDLGLCDAREGASRLERTLASVEGLPKYEGNLYNWYDLTAGEPLGNFVSFVDSGNLAVCLATLSQGLTEYADADERFPFLSAQARRLADETDLTVFYNPKKQLFSLGLDASTGKCERGCYDMMMSESRTASFYAVASGKVPAAHWNALSRAVAARKGYVGMCSWSGTMFEYLMPQLFLPCYPHSFFRETFLFALAAQRRAGKHGLWGISESAFYGFDADLHYRYRAHGVGALALRKDYGGECVFSPYSVYLALSVSPRRAVAQLRTLEQHGMNGPYGLYEAYDTTPERLPHGEDGPGAVVGSYMAHHVGMSLLAAANALQNDRFAERFLADPYRRSASCLLQEKIPARPPRGENPSLSLRPSRALRAKTLSSPEATRVDLSSPRAAILTAGDLTLCAGSTGHILLQKAGKAIFDTRFEKRPTAHTLCVGFSDGSAIVGCTPFFGEGSYTFESSPERISYVSSGKAFSGSVTLSFSRLSPVLRVSARAENRSSRAVFFSFRPVLSEFSAHESHRSFSRLFLGSEYDEEERVLYYVRRSRTDGSPALWLAVAPEDETLPFSFCTDEKCFPAERAGTPDELLLPPDGKTGICTEPFCLLRTDPLPGGKACLLLAPAATREEARNAIRTARRDKTSARTRLPERISDLLTPLCYPDLPHRELPAGYRRELLWKHGVSGDVPLFAFSFGESDRTAASLLSAWNFLSRAGLPSELLCLPEGDGQYFRPAEKRFLSVLEELGLEDRLCRRNGVFVLRKESLDPLLKESLPALCAFPDRPERKREDAFLPFVPPPVRKGEPLPVPVPPGAIPTACGYADEDGFTLDNSASAVAPMSYLLAGKRFGSVITGRSLGYTFAGNAHERRMTPFLGDYGTLPDGELLLLRKNGILYDLIACAGKVTFSHGTAVWEGSVASLSYAVTAFISPDRPCKWLRVRLNGQAEELFLAVRPALGSASRPASVYSVSGQSGAVIFRSGHDPAFADGAGVLFCRDASPKQETPDPFLSSFVTLRTYGRDVAFVLAGCREPELPGLLHSLRTLSPDAEKQAAIAFAKHFLPPVSLSSRSPALDRFFTTFLPYQIAASRFYCRASFRQSGGAFGFRDQLQDGLALVFSDPAAVREHLLRCCSRQYEEGDVQHWWHDDGKGVRTTCSDDLLWLPYAVADYLEKTGDGSLLQEQVPYLSSPPLDGENERYEQSGRSYLSETVLLHCLRAFERADKRGKHGLILMGCCDWNDAFSRVGAEGKGESVFSTFLFIVAANAFLPHLEPVDPAAAKGLRSAAAELLANAERHAYAGDRWIRAFHDDGEVLGTEGRSECAIDILTQAFALFAGADREKCVRALDTAEKRLYDPRHKLLALFDPPFGDGNTDAGYIRSYPKGVRENGGQYTHAAVWGALAFLRVGKKDTALDLLTHMNPLLRTQTASDLLRYRSEPYALCADVYTGELAGMGGWSWYTGSAAWLYKVLLEDVFGLRILSGGCTVDFRPIVPCTLTVHFRKDCTLTLRALCGEPPAPPMLDGTPVALPCTLPPGDHTLTVGL